TLRAYDFRSEIGNEVAFANIEYRFPLIDEIVLFGGFGLSNIRGKFFIDVGAAHLSYGSSVPFRFWNGSGNSIVYNDAINGGGPQTYKPYQLIDGKADYGYGISLNLLGVDLHWDFSKKWDFRRTTSGLRTSFYIGTEF